MNSHEYDFLKHFSEEEKEKVQSYTQSHRFRSCLVAVYDPPWEREMRKVCTAFVDGAISIAVPQWGDPGHIAASWHCGYGGDQWAMMREHELAHAFLADWYNLPYSYPVWSHAHGTSTDTLNSASDRVKREEHLVTSFQRFINTGYLDDWDLLRKSMHEDPRSAESQLQSAARTFLSIARPWLGICNEL